MPADGGAPAAGEPDALLAEIARLRGQLADAEQRAAHLAAQAANERRSLGDGFLRSVLAASSDCIKVLDLDAKFVFMSEGGQRVMEVGDFNAIRGCPWPEFWQGEGNAQAWAAVEAAKAGGTGRFQGAADTMAGTPRHWDVQVTPILGADGRPERLLAVSRDITATWRAEEALRESDARRAFLLRLGDGLRALSDPREVMAVAAGLLGRHLGADRAGYAEVAPAGDTFTVERDWCAPGMPSLAGRHRLDDFGPALIAEFRAGRTVAFDDALRGPLTAGDAAAEAYRAASTRAAITVPLIKGGRFAVAFYVHSREARHWTDEDEALVREVAERTWAAVEQAHAEASLRASQARLGAALAVAQLGTFEWNLLTNAVTLDERSRDIFGFAPGEGGQAQEVFDRIEPSDLRRVLAEAQASIRDRARLDTEYRINLPDGTVRVVASTSNVTLGGSGEAERQFGVFADVTERKRTEARLRELNETLESQVEARTRELARSEARFRAYFDASPENLFLVRVPSGCGAVFEDLNPAAEALCGLPRDAVVGHALVAVLDPETAADVERRAQECLRLDRPLRYETPRRFQFGRELVLNVVAAPLPVPAGGDALVLFCKRDVTEQRQAEEALRQSQKMEAVGQLTGGLAHDFNNLLAGISGSLELLQARMAQGRMNDLERYIAAAQGASKRAAALTHRLLAFTRRQTLDPKPTDVNRLVAGIEELVRRTVGPAVEIEVVGAAGLWTTFVDPNQLENALLNLCINARDAMPDGGRLTIETGNKWLDARAARERDLPPGQYVSLCVSDTGAGMTPEVIRRAFDPFFTTKPIGMGTGLGLSMIYGFVQQSGGQARIYSEPGQGAMVCLYLPRHHGAADAADEPAGQAAVPRAEAGETVLVVDDEPTVRMLVAEVLQDLGYTAIEAADGPAGLRVLQSDARIDLLVTDVGLPGGMNGRQVADAGRAVRPGLKVLFITGYAENAVLSHGHLDPGTHVLTKPFAIGALASQIKELIAGNQGKRAG